MTPYGYPSEQYHCLLDEQPYYLAPPRLFEPDVHGPLVVNPDCWFTWQGPLPRDKAARLEANGSFYPSDWMVWVSDPAMGTLWPYWLGGEYAGYLADQTPGSPLTKELPPHALWVLTRAHILVSPGFAELRRHQWRETAWTAAKNFERGYTPISGLLPVFHLGSLRRYYRYHTRTGSFTLGDGQVSRRYFAHEEPIARFFHYQLRSAIGDIARAALKLSYAYLAAYESGSVLERHTDREQCEYTLTLSVDASPEPEAQVPWPIQLDTHEGSLRLWQHLGDGLLFRGRYLPHYRDALPEGHTSTSLLLHYVDFDFAGPLQ